MVWYTGLTAMDRKSLQRVVKTANDIMGCPLSPLDVITGDLCLRRARNILRDDSHPGQHLFNILPSGKRYRSMISRTNRLKNCFYLCAMRLLNGRQQHCS